MSCCAHCDTPTDSTFRCSTCFRITCNKRCRHAGTHTPGTRPARAKSATEHMMDLGRAQMEMFLEDDDPKMREHAKAVMKIHFETMGEVMRAEVRHARDLAEIESLRH